MHYMEMLSCLVVQRLYCNEPGLIVHYELTHVKEGALFLMHLWCSVHDGWR